MERIEGKVAAILNVRELVINRGTDEGVKVGDEFAVLNRRGFNIKDPDTNAALGSVELPKALVRVARVYPHLAVARTFRTKRTNVGGSLPAIFRSFEQARYVDVPETLKIEGSSFYEEIDEGKSIVKVGDPVVQVTGDEFDVISE